MLPTWVYVAVLAGFASNLYNFYNRKVLKENGDSTAYGWWTEFLRFGAAFLLLPWDFSFTFTLSTVGILLLIGTIEMLSGYIFFKMHKHSDLSISTIISRTRLIWIPMLAFFFLGEKLTVPEYTGILILFFGLSIAVSPHKLKMDKGVQLSYISALIVAVLSVVMKAGSALVSTSVLLVFMSLVSVVCLPLFMKDAKKRITYVFKKHKTPILLASGSNIIAMYFYVYALRIGEVSKVMGIYQGMMIVSILGGIILLNERQDVGKKIFGAIITIAGILMLSLR
jgi:drug/metabolite transporter (DMT)-like permease